MAKNLKLFSARVKTDGETSTVKPVRMPADLLLKLYGLAKRENKSVNRVMVETLTAGYDLLEKGEQ